MADAYQYTCDPGEGQECAFRIRSEDRDELVEIVREHSRNKHGMDVSADEIRAGLEEVQY